MLWTLWVRSDGLFLTPEHVLVVQMDSGTNANVVLVIRTVPNMFTNIVPPTPQHGRGEKNRGQGRAAPH